MKLANRIQTILCDDVRTETGNKFSLMGVYPRNIVFQKLPAILPKICFCIMMQGVKTDFQKSEVTLKFPEAEPVRLQLKLSEDSHLGKDIALFAVISPFRAKAVGTAKFEVRFAENKRPSIIHKFQIEVAKKNR